MSAAARGLENVVVGSTRLSRVDGEAGSLVIGGFPVEELAPRARFEEVLFLLWRDRLPTGPELADLRNGLAAARALPKATLAVLAHAAAAGLDAMDALRLGVASLPLADPDLARTELDGEPRAANERRGLALVAATSAIVASFHRLRGGEAPVAPDPALDHAANHLFMLRGERPDPAAARALETYLNTTIDHGLNASTFTARVIVSTRSDLVSAVAGAIGALKGPLHGGAPGPALDLVLALRDEARREERPLAEVAEREVRRIVREGGRIMGFGHRVYRVRDPRADVLGAALDTFAPAAGGELLADAQRVEAVILRVLAETKPGRRLDTNVEFYTALLLHGIGLPADLFTATFAVARVGGWVAHAFEQIAEGRLIRPSVHYAGETSRRWQPLEARAA
ncbi:MAG TPA: citrate/2-methylcitrate synthase [Myxococcota bacterium]|jgi:citrate synthase|nr:citrate/2-methylcitrate synthase [Myxococcota bacterium]